MEALKAELAAATQRATRPRPSRREATSSWRPSEKDGLLPVHQRESQKNANIWQLKCHDLQQQVDELQSRRGPPRVQLNTAAAPAAPHIRSGAGGQARAGKILADARLYAESAERELKQQAETQKKPHGGECPQHCFGRHAGAERLARVDERLSAATLDSRRPDAGHLSGT